MRPPRPLAKVTVRTEISFPSLSGSRLNHPAVSSMLRTQEPDQSLDVPGSGRQEDLLSEGLLTQASSFRLRAHNDAADRWGNGQYRQNRQFSGRE
jgi:hypothetical protein